MPPTEQAAKAKTTIVKMSTGMAGDDFNFNPGDTVECPTDTADTWVRKGIARHCKDTEAMHEYRPGPSELAKAQLAEKERREKKAKSKAAKPVNNDD